MANKLRSVAKVLSATKNTQRQEVKLKSVESKIKICDKYC